MTDDTRSIIPSVTGDEEWVDIINQLTDQLSAHDLPDKVVKAAELMLVGTPNYQIASRLNVSPQTVRKWLSDYPIIAMVVAQGKKLLSKWRMAQLEQQFLQSVGRSQEILDVNLDGTDKDGNKVNPKILTVVAAQSRYIIGLFAGQKVDVTVTHELGDTVMKAKEDALDYLAEKLNEQKDGAQEQPIEAIIRVVDPHVDNNAPLLDEHGNPVFGKMGCLDTSSDGTECHLCGKHLKSLRRHIENGHGMTCQEYEMTFMLDDGAVKNADNKALEESDEEWD
jgi:hypothetical protein